jgi:hypothetical protein
MHFRLLGTQQEGPKMKYRSMIFVLAVTIILAIASTPEAFAQFQRQGRVEVTVLGGFTWFVPNGGAKSEYAISVPAGSGVVAGLPALRITCWPASQLSLDLGFSYLHAGSGSDKTEILNIEGGVGGSFGQKGSRTQPFCSVLFGLLSVSANSQASESYLGGQLGVRNYIRDYAAVHLQLGYRRMLGKTFGFSTVEIAGGLGFFL